MVFHDTCKKNKEMEFGKLRRIFLLYSLLLFEISAEGHRMFDDKSLSGQKPQRLDPELNVFFHPDDLKLGNMMLIYFPTKDPSVSPHLLSREDSDSIPFSSSRFPHILERFNLPATSKQASAMRSTLRYCETPPPLGEIKFCASSLDSLLDALLLSFGSGSKFRVLTTNHLSELVPVLQNYTVSDPPESVPASKLIACHSLPYPYLVLYCHGQAGDNKLYKVVLDGEDAGRVDAVAICHMDTSQWDPKHVAFRVLGTIPGASPVCHFFPQDNLVWVRAEEK